MTNKSTMFYSEKLGLSPTDNSNWRLRTSILGAAVWEYVETPQADDLQSPMEKYLLGSDDFEPPVYNDRAKDAFESAIRGAEFFRLLQAENGTWPNMYQGPMFMTVGYVAACYFTKTTIPEAYKTEMIRYYINVSHPVDGGWGLYNVDKSTCFGTTMGYVCLRLLGLPPHHTACVRARDTLHRLGGAVANPHWGKAWLAILNLYEWEGVNPAPADLFMLPQFLPIFPFKWWVHTRAIYLAMSYVSSVKGKCELDPLLLSLRTEIYTKSYGKIDFSKERNNVCGVDLYYPHTGFLNLANNVLVFYEKYLRPDWWNRRVNKTIYEYVLKELKNTEYLGIAPVSAAFNTIVTYMEEGPDSENFQKTRDRLSEVLFKGPEGITVMGTNGSQTWDSSFAVQYLFMAGLAERPEFKDMIVRAYKFLIRSQFTDECADGSFRDRRKGAWPFSTKEQGYTVSDCTAEAIKAIIMVKNSEYYKDVHHLYDERNLEDGIDILLGLQNVGNFHFGSFSTYEKNKATPLLEALNPAEVFGNIMVEYPYIECTDSSVLGLKYFTDHYEYRRDEINLAIDRAIKYIRANQNEDGSWYGCWGVCFTYAGMFALEALSVVGNTYESDLTVRKGCDFLVSRQLPDGGWGESMKSSEMHEYFSSPNSLVVQTAWVVIALILAEYPQKDVIDRGIKLIMDRQQSGGNWKFESVEGVFNHSCGIEYPNYKFMFTIKALGLYSKTYA
ncbi:unnamed protein product [Kuraishia capsulata CBS 1993]|uniref:Terpene cyclase/mutase family member n=1 Tax=Kuraishia capsulata CBS 1993 TaxID=1382522 RepID=W6MKY6_9ASCO|nr:uncharacterized protein KUCA_T00001407001 [Kuraishia capsulata CBS 1993]CDK25437.1 unnamed protein product [Kuraishia capsulata CBS 1993]